MLFDIVGIIYVINELLHEFSFIFTHIFHCIHPQVNDSTESLAIYLRTHALEKISLK